MLVKARTGTGKTLAFALPVAHRLLSETHAKGGDKEKERSGQRGLRLPRALVLAPTRELAKQTCDQFTIFGAPVLRPFAIYGGTSYDNQGVFVFADVTCVGENESLADG